MPAKDIILHIVGTIFKKNLNAILLKYVMHYIMTRVLAPALVLIDSKSQTETNAKGMMR